MAEPEFAKRLADLARLSGLRSGYTFTSFLGEAEREDYYRIRQSLQYACPTEWGGHEEAERIMVRFGNPEELGYEEPFPILCIRITPLAKKFAEELSHRDYLGTLMNLGMDRRELGDILVRKDEAYLFATEQMGRLILSEVTRVRHTAVSAALCEAPAEVLKPVTDPGTLQASSLRVDGFISKLCKLSRSAAYGLFSDGKVFVNGRCMENESYLLKEGDKVSVRGYGKFRFLETAGTTRKGSLILSYEKYV